jgi:hypothetical protein
MKTLVTTGPEALAYLYKTNALGVAQDDPSVQLPHTYAGNFSMAEKNHSWLAAGNSPQRDDDAPTRSTGPGGSSQKLQQRVSRPSSRDQSSSSSQGQKIARTPSR